MALPALFLALFSLPLLAAGPGDDLQDLTSADARTRELATRRLCAELNSEQAPALIELAGRADYELERRITRILAARDERLPLVLELFTKKSRRSRVIARAAFRELLSRWNLSYAAEPISGEALNALLFHSQRGLVELPASSGKPASLLERFSQGARLGLPLVFDRGVDLIPSRSMSAMRGTPLELLEGLCARDNLSYRLHGHSPDSAGVGATGEWIRVSAARDAALSSTEEILLAWSLRVREGASDAPAAARALANTGWTAPLLWFEERWRERADPAALSGLLAAASRGRTALVLTELETQLAVRERLDELASTGAGEEASAEIEEIARGVARLAGRSGRGEDLSELWQTSSAETPPLALWARLLILEGHGRGACELTQRVLSEGARSRPELWFRALKAHVSDRSETSSLDWDALELSTDELLGLASRHGIGRALHQFGLRSGELSGQPGLELLGVELAIREGARCGELLHSLWADGAEEAEVEAQLVAWRVEFGRSRVALALGDFVHLEESGWQRLLELSGVISPGSIGDAGEDLERLACGAGAAGGADLRALLLEELSTVEPAKEAQLKELWMVWRRVAWALQESGQEEALRSFWGQTTSTAVEREVLQELLRGFPPHPRGLFESIDLGLLRQ